MEQVLHARGAGMEYCVLFSSSTVCRQRRCLLSTPTSFLKIFKTVSLLLASFFLFGFALWAQKPKDQPPAEYKIPPEAAAKPNPVKPNQESLARGKKLYGYDCAMCHGKDGDGKGDMAAGIKNYTHFTKSQVLKNGTDRR